MKTKSLFPFLCSFGFALLILILEIPSAQAGARVWPSQWHSTQLCKPLNGSQSCVEVVRVDYQSNLPKKGTVALIPGFFQNGAVFDVLPENGISFANFLMKEKGLQVYFIHVRGIGNSSQGPKYNMDDLAMDDIPDAIQFISKQEHEKIFVFGHSQGGITLKASMSGLDHCQTSAGASACFNPTTALFRQKYVRGILSIASNSSMSTRYHHDSLHFMGQLGWFLHSITNSILNYIPARKLINDFEGVENLVADASVWDFLYSTANASDAAKQALYEKTLDGSSIGIINQFADGVDHDGIKNGSGELYTDALKNIQIPVGEVTFELDYFAPPQETFEDSYSRLNPKLRKFYAFPAQRHEDFMLEPALTSEFSGPVDWLLQMKQ